VAVEANTLALYFLNGPGPTVIDQTGNFNGTEISTVSHPTTPAPWNAPSWLQSTSPLRTGTVGHFTMPNGVVDTGNASLEFAFETGADVTNSQQIFEVGTTGLTRAFSAYIFGGNVYLFNEGVANAVAFPVLANTRYYVKFTYDGVNTKVYSGAFTTPGTVTLTLGVTAGAPNYAAAVNKARFIQSFNSTSNFLGKIDNVRWRNVTDFSTNVTTDPVNSGSAVSAILQNRRR